MLFELESPTLALNIRQAEAEARIAEVSMRQALLNVRDADQFQVYTSERDRVARLMTDLAVKEDQESIRAPFDGRVTDLADQLTVGRWVGDRTQLAFAVSDDPPVIWAYIRESDLSRLKAGDKAWFFSDLPETPALPLRLESIDYDSAVQIPFPGLIVQHGGRIEAVENDSGQFEPVDAVYRVQLTVLEDIGELQRLQHGVVVVKGRRESLLSRAWTQAASVFVREASF